MVTIEQKLTLFSKLLNQGIKEEMDEQFIQLEKEYERRIAENKFAVNEEAKEIINQAKQRAEIKKLELMSRGKLSSKREMMQLKEKMIVRFMNALEKKVSEFTQSPAYLKYLRQLINSTEELKKSMNPLTIYMTKLDYDQHQEFIKQALVEKGFNVGSFSFEVSNKPILGGLIIVDTIDNTRIDMSILEIIEESKDKIVDKISRSIGEVGDKIDD